MIGNSPEAKCISSSIQQNNYKKILGTESSFRGLENSGEFVTSLTEILRSKQLDTISTKKL